MACVGQYQRSNTLIPITASTASHVTQFSQVQMNLPIRVMA
jgi:hypothetical protein